jgi:hypothetical protein
MRIVRYPLEIVDYQQVQPLWPGRVLSVAPGRLIDPATGMEIEYAHRDQKIDMWCIDDSGNPAAGPTPILGVWIVGTGHPMPPGLLDNDTNCFHGTCVMANGLVWHVFTTIDGVAEQTPQPLGEVSSIDDMIDHIKARHAHRRQP